MKQTAFTEEHIAYALHQAETRTPAADICRKLGISAQTFYRWKKKFAGMGTTTDAPSGVVVVAPARHAVDQTPGGTGTHEASQPSL